MIKITIEENGVEEVVETEYMLLMTGNKDKGKLYTQLDVKNLTYEETTRTNALLGFMIIDNMHNQTKEEL